MERDGGGMDTKPCNGASGEIRESQGERGRGEIGDKENKDIMINE